MFAKVAILCATLVAINAAALHHGVALAHTGKSVTSRHDDAHGNYAFGYDVIDGGHASSKSQSEVGDGHGHKKSTYSSHINHVAPAVAVAHAAPVAHVAPVAVAHVAPVAVAHAAPVAVAHAAPVPFAPLAVGHIAPAVHAAPFAVAHDAPVAYKMSSVIKHVAAVPVVSHVAPVPIAKHLPLFGGHL